MNRDYVSPEQYPAALAAWQRSQAVDHKDVRHKEQAMIDYARMKKSGPKLKAMLTRAQSKSDAQSRYFYVKQACKAAVTEWDAVGAWIDDWSRWQRALDDAYYKLPFESSYRNGPRRLEEL